MEVMPPITMKTTLNTTFQEKVTYLSSISNAPPIPNPPITEIGMNRVIHEGRDDNGFEAGLVIEEKGVKLNWPFRIGLALPALNVSEGLIPSIGLRGIGYYS